MICGQIARYLWWKIDGEWDVYYFHYKIAWIKQRQQQRQREKERALLDEAIAENRKRGYAKRLETKARLKAEVMAAEAAVDSEPLDLNAWGDRQAIGACVRDMRRQCGWSIRQLGYFAGLYRSQVLELELCIHQGPSRLKLIADAFKGFEKRHGKKLNWHGWNGVVPMPPRRRAPISFQDDDGFGNSTLSRICSVGKDAAGVIPRDARPARDIRYTPGFFLGWGQNYKWSDVVDNRLYGPAMS